MSLSFGTELFKRDSQYDDDGNLNSSSVIEGARNKTQLIEYAGRGTAGSETFVTVPAGKVLYLTTAQISIAGTNGSVDMLAVITIDGDELFLVNIGQGTDKFWSNEINFPMPIKVNAGEAVLLTQTSTGYSSKGIVTGWYENI